MRRVVIPERQQAEVGLGLRKLTRSKATLDAHPRATRECQYQQLRQPIDRGSMRRPDWAHPPKLPSDKLDSLAREGAKSDQPVVLHSAQRTDVLGDRDHAFGLLEPRIARTSLPSVGDVAQF